MSPLRQVSLLLCMLMLIGACATRPQIQSESADYGHAHSYLHQQRLGRDYIRLGTTGGSHAPDNPMAIDHVTLVTVTDGGLDIANIRMSGIFDKSGKIPLDGDELCLQECSGK